METDLIFLNAQNYLFVNNPNYLKNGWLGDSENGLDQFSCNFNLET